MELDEIDGIESLAHGGGDNDGVIISRHQGSVGDIFNGRSGNESGGIGGARRVIGEVAVNVHADGSGEFWAHKQAGRSVALIESLNGEYVLAIQEEGEMAAEVENVGVVDVGIVDAVREAVPGQGIRGVAAGDLGAIDPCHEAVIVVHFQGQLTKLRGVGDGEGNADEDVARAGGNGGVDHGGVRAVVAVPDTGVEDGVVDRESEAGV